MQAQYHGTRISQLKKMLQLQNEYGNGEITVPLKIWVWAICLNRTSLKGIFFMKLFRYVDVCQATTWFMLQRIREGLIPSRMLFEAPVEVYFDSLEKNKHERKKARMGRGPASKTAVATMRDGTIGLIRAQLYADSTSSCKNIDPLRNTVAHSVLGYVNGWAHVGGMESFWVGFKWTLQGTHHQICKRHSNRYVVQPVGKQNMYLLGTVAKCIMCWWGLLEGEFFIGN